MDLSVSDIDAATDWYVKVLGLRELHRATIDGRKTSVLLARDAGLIIGLNEHPGRPEGRFDERRVGLDHVGFDVPERADLDVWERHLVELGVEHSPVTDVEVGAALVFRDLDNIQLEIWWTKPREAVLAERAAAAAASDSAGS